MTMSRHLAHHLTVRIAGIAVTLDLAASPPAVRDRLHEHYSAFAVASAGDAVHVRLTVEPGPEFIPIAGARTWAIRTWARDGKIQFESFFESGWADLTSGTGALVMRPGGDPENYLRVLYAWLCLERGALLVHACGIVRDDEGYVFFGPSGDGKTTIARLSAQDTVLSDDLVILSRSAEGGRVHGVPFRGDLPEAPRSNASARLCGLFALAKDVEHRRVPLASSEAVARLAACVPFVMAQPAHAVRVVTACADLVGAVPVERLHFRRDAGFWRLMDEPESLSPAPPAGRVTGV